jgi:hypothetical protein
MTTKLASRIAKLEEHRAPPRKYVIRVSDPIAAEEQAEIDSATLTFILAPHKSETVEEWLAEHAPR